MNDIKSLNTKKFKKYIETEDLLILHDIKLYNDDIYYNSGKTELSDVQYDMLKDIIQKRDPDYIPPIGAKIRDKTKSVILPFHLGSANKFTPNEKEGVIKWIQNNPSPEYVISDKLDGVSALFSIKNNIFKLYTRGDGNIGKDISHIIPFIKNIPKKIKISNNKKELFIRGELIISKEIFQTKYRNKQIDGKIYKSARNMVSGIINSKKAKASLQDLEFISYEIVEDNPVPILYQLKILKSYNFQVVKYNIVEIFTIENLKKIICNFKLESSYEIDGIIITRNTSYDRSIIGNPDYMFAFKIRLEEDIYSTIVKHIEWNVSKWSKLIPVVVFEPVNLPDFTMERVSANNAKYIEDNKLGPGSIIKVVRSKEVIPYIVEIVKSTKPQFPDIPFNWDKKHVHIITSGNDMYKQICIKKLSSFFSKMNIEYVSEATIKKLYNAGYDNLFKILNMTTDELMTIPTIKQKSAERIYTNIKNGFLNIEIPYIIGVSGIMGPNIGKKRVEELFINYPNILEDINIFPKNILISNISLINGFSDIIATQIVDNIHLAKKFIDKLKKYATFKEKIITDQIFLGMKIVFTGFRNKNLETQIQNKGGKVLTCISKNTSILIVKQKDVILTGKPKKAQELGVQIMTLDEFNNKYFV